MAVALRAARRAEGRTFPNPPVGAVLAHEDVILATGHHRMAGAPHAEIEALTKVGPPPPGASLYVTMEPCAHHGRTPPCTDAILAAGIRRVVLGALDPHPHTDGRGVARLRSAGVEVVLGVLEAECRELIRGFASVCERGRPFVVLKIAASLDGRIATRTGHSRWVTSELARREVHRMRDRLDAVLVGAGTVRVDDPLLTCRLARGRDPIRIVVSASLDLPEDAKVFEPRRKPGWPSVILATTHEAPEGRARAMEARGAEVMRLESVGGRIDPGMLLSALGARGVTTLLVEGGSTVAASFLEGGWVDEVSWFVGPIIVGGSQAVPAVAGEGVSRMDEAWSLDPVLLSRLGPDILIRGRPHRRPAGEDRMGGKVCSPG